MFSYIPMMLDLRFSCLVHLPALRGLVDGGSVAVSSSSIMTVTTEGDPSLTAGLAGPEKLISNSNDSSVSLSLSLIIVTRYVCNVSPGENLTIAGSSSNKKSFPDVADKSLGDNLKTTITVLLTIRLEGGKRLDYCEKCLIL